MLWLKSLHIIFMVTWFAGLFYLPRLFVYHAMTEDDVGKRRFKLMERKLYWGIATPGAIITCLLGVGLLALLPNALQQGWMQAKLALVMLLIAYHIHCGYLMRAFAQDRNRHSHRWFRVYNELPVLALIAIVMLVVIRPF